jgi:hypothetical protein
MRSSGRGGDFLARQWAEAKSVALQEYLACMEQQEQRLLVQPHNTDHQGGRRHGLGSQGLISSTPDLGSGC